MLHLRKLSLTLLPAAAVILAAPSHAALINTYDLATLCFMSTDVVEARLTRHHQPGKEEWRDMFTATVLDPLEGSHKAGDQIRGLDLDGYDPARTGQHCILFLAPSEWLKGTPLSVVDMLLIDNRSRVRRYFQWSDPGGLVADSFNLTSHPPTKITHIHGGLVSIYQGNNTFEEDDAAEQRFRTLAEERLLIAAKWVAAKKLKAPSYRVLHQTER